MKKKEGRKEPSVRQRKVASYLNRKLSEMFASGEIEGLSGIITITKVDVSGDLRHATVWFSALKQDAKEVLSVLRRNLYDIQGELYRDSTMRIMPKVNFRVDNSGSYADHINRLLSDLKHEQ